MEKNRGVLLSEMSEVKDPAIKLFGKTIQLPSNDDVSLAPCRSDLVLLDCEGNSDHNNLSCSDGSVSPKSIHSKSNTAIESKPENSSLNNESESSSSQETPLKKPDKIIPCPRCNSMDTKFCYFNNYNVNQPRHFCKGCQRYWTAGGAIRNVPVGSGRRKAKSSTNPNPFIIPESTNLMVSALNIAEKSSCQVPFYAAPPWYPAPYSPFWGACNVPWQAMSASNSSPGSLLGKHSREGEEEKATKVLVPKTLRIDDPSEAAKSSIWATLGIRNGRGADSINSGGVFGGFRSKGGEMNSAAEGSLVLQANPAAFSRSLRFHESAE